MNNETEKDKQPQIPTSPTVANAANSDDGVIVIGAGAAGLTAAYDLKRKAAIPVTVLEAHESLWGGRVKKVSDFCDFPIDVGAEWIHLPPKRVLPQIVDTDNPEIQSKISNIQTRIYQFAPFYEWRKWGGWWLKYSAWEENEVLWRFVDSTWHDFLEEYIVDSIRNDIHYGCVVNRIDYLSDIVVVTCTDGRTFRGKQVIVATSLPTLQQSKIQFHPPLPQKKQQAMESITFEPGFKAFFEFSEMFYPHKNFSIRKKHKRSHGEMYFYDESALHSNKSRHILAVFAYGDMAQHYVNKSDDEILQMLLQELDEAYKGQATRCYMKGIVQNWTAEPHIGGNYSSYRRGMAPMFTVQQPLQNKVFFAGEHLPVNGSQYGFVDGAALSGRAAATAVMDARQGKKPSFPWRMWCISNVLGALCCGIEQRLFFRDVD